MLALSVIVTAVEPAAVVVVTAAAPEKVKLTWFEPTRVGADSVRDEPSTVPVIPVTARFESGGNRGLSNRIESVLPVAEQLEAFGTSNAPTSHVPAQVKVMAPVIDDVPVSMAAEVGVKL